MAWHLPYRLNPLHYAMSAALLCVTGIAVSLPSAKAATLGKTTITSAQHEPLFAVISVTDIKASDFSANLANAVIYQQMGLTPTDSMSVNFVPTSATTGQVIISTSQPVSKPFADVVLTVNDNGQRNVIPKTLLMPLGASAPAKKTTNRVIANATKPNLPVISAAPVIANKPLTAVNNGKPLALKSGTPPPLFESSKAAQSLPSIKASRPIVNQALPVVSLASVPSLPVATSTNNAAPTSRPSLSNSLDSSNSMKMDRMTASSSSSMLDTQTLNIQSNSRVTSRATANRTDSISDNTVADSLNAVSPAPSNNTMANADNKQSIRTPSTPIAASSATNVQKDLLNQTNNDNSVLANKNALNNQPENTAQNRASDNKALDSSTLNIQVTRQISVRNSPLNQVDSTDSPTLALKFDDTMVSLTGANKATSPILANGTQATDNQALVKQALDKQALAKQESEQAPDSQAAASLVSSNASANSRMDQTDSAPRINYTVQRNDNLWIISKQIAEQNNLDISTVMSQIKAQNPDAFINKDADQLKADAQLTLPNYEVVPSENSIQAAIAAQRERYLQADKPVNKDSDKTKSEPMTAADETQSAPAIAAATAKKAATKAVSKPEASSTKTTTQTLPQARFSVVAPNSKGKADGTQTKSASATGNGLDNQTLASLKSSRQRTAAQAQRVKSSSNTLGSYTQKLQLQNQRLAELEARLKKLRNQ